MNQMVVTQCYSCEVALSALELPQVRVGKGKPLPYGCTQAKKGHELTDE